LHQFVLPNHQILEDIDSFTGGKELVCTTAPVVAGVQVIARELLLVLTLS
jgi:hypothetical protein